LRPYLLNSAADLPGRANILGAPTYTGVAVSFLAEG